MLTYNKLRLTLLEFIFMFYKNKVIGIALCSIAIGMIIITILPKGSLGIILAIITFIIGLYLIRKCYY